MQSLSHPNIVQIIDFGFNQPISKKTKKQTCNYIVMELCENGSLWDYLIMNGPLNHQESLRLFSQLLSALEYIHDKSVAHRDLKPQNLLLDHQGNLKLSDFGLSTVK